MRAFMLAALALLPVLLGSAPALAARVTVVIALEPTKFSGKPWDIQPGADPILCLREGCYLSQGHTAPAKFEPRRTALMALNILFTPKAGTCANSLTCIFRSVDLPSAETFAQPVDVDIEQHDRLEFSLLKPDGTCRIEDGVLECYEGVFTREYSIWVVPEEVAAQAGARALEQAVTQGLHVGRTTFAEEFLGEARESLPEALGNFYGLVLDQSIGAQCKRDLSLLASTFRLAGFTGDGRPELTALVQDFVGYRNPEAQIAMLHDRPWDFWALHDSVQGLLDMAAAQEARPDGNSDGLTLDQSGDHLALIVGGNARTEAETLIDSCKFGRHAAGQRRIPSKS